MFRAPALLLMVVACSKTVAFQGDSTLAITAAAPAPPAVAPDPPRVEVRDNQIVIHEKVQFALDQATILATSFGLLDEVASVIKKNPQLKKIRVEGHASSEGDAGHNLKLSDERAQSVLTYLVNHGVAKNILTSKGFGIDRPIADNATEDGREKNRRVEFNILEQDVTSRRVEIDKAGKEKVLEEKKQTVRATDNATSSK